MMVREMKRIISIRNIIFPKGSPDRNLILPGGKISYFQNIHAINILLHRISYDTTQYVEF